MCTLSLQRVVELLAHVQLSLEQESKLASFQLQIINWYDYNQSKQYLLKLYKRLLIHIQIETDVEQLVVDTNVFEQEIYWMNLEELKLCAVKLRELFYKQLNLMDS